MLENYSVHATQFKTRCKENKIELVYLPPNCTDLVEPIDAGIGAAIKNRMNKMLEEDMEISEERSDAWFDGTVTTSERRVLYSKLLAKAHAKIDPEKIKKCFKRMGCYLDMDENQDDLVHLDQLQTFKVPKYGDPKMKKLTTDKIADW